PVGSVSRALFVSGGSAAKETGPRARIRTAKASRQRVMGEAPWREGRGRLDGQTEPESNGRGGPRQAELVAISGGVRGQGQAYKRRDCTNTLKRGRPTVILGAS